MIKGDVTSSIKTSSSVKGNYRERHKQGNKSVQSIHHEFKGLGFEFLNQFANHMLQVVGHQGTIL